MAGPRGSRLEYVTRCARIAATRGSAPRPGPDRRGSRARRVGCTAKEPTRPPYRPLSHRYQGPRQSIWRASFTHYDPGFFHNETDRLTSFETAFDVGPDLTDCACRGDRAGPCDTRAPRATTSGAGLCTLTGRAGPSQP